MAERVYLDSSAIVKRYVKESGTGTIDALFKKAETGNLIICFSAWNIAETIGVFDQYNRKGLITIKTILDKFINELNRLKDKGHLEVLDITNQTVFDAIDGTLKYHIYVADSIQVVTCKQSYCDSFITADKKLHQIAQKKGIKSTIL